MNSTPAPFCYACGKQIHRSSPVCPYCGASQGDRPGLKAAVNRDKNVAALLALFLGGFGVHRMYLGQWRALLYLIFFWTLVPAAIAIVEAIVFFAVGRERWDRTHNAPSAPERSRAAIFIVAAVLAVAGVPTLGILLAIAIPAYQDYVVRAKINQGLAMASNIKIEAGEYLLEHGAFPKNNAAIGISSTPSGSGVKAITIHDGGIVITYDDDDVNRYASDANQSPGAAQLILRPVVDGSIVQWTCKEGPMKERYKPRSCR